MTKPYSNLMKSRFFTPAFNSAIFDGPVRIYFAQFNESAALKIYFAIQDRFGDRLSRLTDKSRNIFVLLYPNKDTFRMSFSHSENRFRRDVLGEDEIIGVCGISDEVTPIFDHVDDIMGEWEFEEACRATGPELSL